MEREADSRKKAYVNVTLIILNVLFFIYLEFNGSTENAHFMYQNGAMFAPAVLEEGEYYRLLTAMFMHFGIRHIQSNMLVLFILGDNLERALGHLKYLFFYLFCGIGANAVSLFFNGMESRRVAAGASGAVFGVVGGLLYIVTINRGRLEDLNTLQLTVMIFFSLYSGFASTGVDNVAHVAGLLLGAVLSFVLYRK